MRIHVYGNVLNWGMGFARLLREGGHDVRLFINRDEPSFYHPKWEYPDFSPAAYPWVEFVDIRPERLLVGAARERAFLRRLADCDVVQTFGEYSIWAMFAGCPYVTFSYGADLESLAFATGGGKRWLLRALIRRAFRRAAVFVYALPKHRSLVQSLNLKNAEWFPDAVPIDTDRYAPYPPEARRALRATFPHRWVFLHAARQEWTRRAANDKANDRLFEAFARFVTERDASAVLLAVRKGRDVAASEVLIARLGIADHVQWIDELDKPGLIRMLNSVDAFCDQFEHGYYGVSTLEALSCGVPTFVYLNPADTVGLELPPVFSGRTKDEIFAALSAFADVHSAADERGRLGREWVVRHHGHASVRGQYERFYRTATEAHHAH